MYENNQKFFLIITSICLLILVATGGFTYGNVFVAVVITTLVMCIVAMILQCGAYQDGKGRPRSIKSMVINTPYLIVAFGEIAGKKLVWLKKVKLISDHQKLVLEREAFCYEYKELPEGADQATYLELNLEPATAQPGLSIWLAPVEYITEDEL